MMFVLCAMSFPLREHSLFVVVMIGVEEQVFDVVGFELVHLASEYVLLSEPLQVTVLD